MAAIILPGGSQLATDGQCWLIGGALVNLFVSCVATHFADSVLQHGVLLEEVVYGNFVLSVVVHRALEEEAQEALDAVTAVASSEVAQQNEVEAERSSEDRVAAEEVDLDLHGVAHPAEDVDVVPAFLVVVARGIVVDTYFVVVLSIFVVAVAVEVGLLFGNEDRFQGRELGNFLGAEVSGFRRERDRRGYRGCWLRTSRSGRGSEYR